MKKTFLSMLLIGSGCALFAQVQQTTRDTVPTTTTTPLNTTPTTSTPDDKTTLRSTGNYSAYNAVVSVPSNIQTSFTTANPGVTDVRWEQNNDWYRATYTTGARRMRMMYDMRGNSFALALPVTQGLVPDEVIEKAYTLYGDNIYDITLLKTAPPKQNTMNTTTMNNSGTMNGTTTTVNTTTTTNPPANGTTAMNNGTTMNTGTMNVGGIIYQVRVIENGEVRTERMNEDGTPYTESYWRVDSVDVNTMNAQDMNQQNVNQQNWNNTTTDSLQQVTDTSRTNMSDSTMNNAPQSSNTPSDGTGNEAPTSPTDDSSNKANTDATLPNSEPKLEK
jgi:hypothetical protein